MFLARCVLVIGEFMKVFKINKLWYVMSKTQYHTFKNWDEVIVYLEETMSFLYGNG